MVGETPTPTEDKLVFGKYAILRRHAVGGMGEVFLAKQTGIGGFQRHVILKSLLPDLAEQESFVNQFLDEARVAASLNHSNIVQIYEVGKWRGLYFIAMEYIRGGNLADLRKRAKRAGEDIPIGVGIRILHDAALGLEAAHLAIDHEGQPLHLVHRDISPQNIMVRHDGVTKVVDFGIALASNRATRTATGVLKGKYAYMSPEQISGKDLDGRSDQFSLGVVFWELFTHQRLFKANTDAEVLKKVLNTPAPPVIELRKDFPVYLSQVIEKMLNRDPAQRFTSCEEVAVMLMPYLKASGSEGSMVDLQAFAKRVGLGESVDQATPSVSGDFLVSLKPFPKVGPDGGLEEGEIPIAMTVEFPVDDLLQPKGPPRKRWALLGGAGLGLVVAAALFFSGAFDGTSEPTAEKTPEDAPPAVVAAPATARLILRATPAGTLVTLDTKRLGPVPQELTELEPGTTLALHFELEGHQSETRSLTLEAGETRTLEIALIATPRTPPEQRRGKRGRGRRGKRPPKTTAIASAPGFLTLKTSPWTEVSLAGRSLGVTPLFKLSLPAGQHTLRLKNDKAGISVKKMIRVPSGKTLKLDLDLR